MPATFKRAKFSVVFLILLPSLALVALFLYQDYSATLQKAHTLIAKFPITPEMAAELHHLVDPLNRLNIKIILLLLLILIIGYVRLFYIFRKRDESFLDPATKVFNRRYYHEVMKTLDWQHYQIFLLHIENFNDIHSRYDEEITDIMMKSITNRVLRIIRRHDIFIRFEGASFIIFFKIKRNEKADILAQRVINTLKKPIIAEGLYLNVDLRIAINSSPQRSSSLQEAITVAKGELRSIKTNSYTSSSNESFYSGKKSRTVFQLQEALKNKRLVPIYQPIYDALGISISGHEIFVRIRSDETTFISAKHFIDLISDDPLSIEVDNTMLQSALTLLKEHTGQVHVNLHVNSLLEPNFLARLEHRLRHKASIASRLSFEINGLKHHNITPVKESLKQHIQQLKTLGITVILDLFNTDDLSFNDVLFMNPDRLKLPADIANSDSLTLIKLSKEMNIPLMLKKIQNEDELNFARTHRIDYLQGYFLQAPDFNIKENS